MFNGDVPNTSSPLLEKHNRDLSKVSVFEIVDFLYCLITEVTLFLIL